MSKLYSPTTLEYQWLTIASHGSSDVGLILENRWTGHHGIEPHSDHAVAAAKQQAQESVMQAEHPKCPIAFQPYPTFLPNVPLRGAKLN